MARTEIRLSGFGGQGVILAGYVIGKAAAVYENRHATFNQSYGPEARGSACSAQIVLSDEPVSYPYLHSADFLIAMSQEGYTKFVAGTRPDATVLIDDSLVTAHNPGQRRVMGVPATRLAEKLGKRIVANMVMLGFLAATTRALGVEALREAIKTSVPAGLDKLNLAAMEEGLKFGHELMGAAVPAEAGT